MYSFFIWEDDIGYCIKDVLNNMFSWLADRLVLKLLPDPKILLSLTAIVAPIPLSPEKVPPARNCPVLLFSSILIITSDLPSFFL